MTNRLNPLLFGRVEIKYVNINLDKLQLKLTGQMCLLLFQNRIIIQTILY